RALAGRVLAVALAVAVAAALAAEVGFAASGAAAAAGAGALRARLDRARALALGVALAADLAALAARLEVAAMDRRAAVGEALHHRIDVRVTLRRLHVDRERGAGVRLEDALDLRRHRAADLLGAVAAAGLGLELGVAHPEVLAELAARGHKARFHIDDDLV